MNVVLLGPPGAGKGTQAKLVKEYLSCPHISTGDLLRDAVKKELPIGKEAKSYMDKGELVPDEIVVRMVADRLTQSDTGNGFLLDGFPRTIEQAKFLGAELDKIDKGLDLVVYFKTSEEVCVSRLSGRRICRDCGAIYHVKNMPPKSDGVCDVCEGELYQRDDDKEETVRNRFRVYEKQTEDLIKYYGEMGLLYEVSGDTDAEELFEILKKKFDSIQKNA